MQRPKSPLRALTVQLRPEKDPVRFLLIGHPASGKSTELVKLAAELEKQHGHLVIRIDLEQNLNIQKVNPLETLFLIGVAVYKVAHEELGKARKPLPNRAHLDALTKCLETTVRSYTDKKNYSVDIEQIIAGLVCASAGAVYAGPLGAAAGAAVAPKVAEVLAKMVRFSLGFDTEVVRKRENAPVLEDMVQQINALIADVQEKAGTPVVLLVDGLDKPKEIDIVALNFEDTPALSDLACRVVYTAPVWIRYHPRFAGVRDRFSLQPFPNIKLYDRHDWKKTDPAGYETLQSTVYKRLRSLSLTPAEILPESLLTRLIQGSAGVMRDLIRLVREAATLAEIAEKTAIEEPEVVEALRAMHRELAGRITPDYHSVLEIIHQNHERLNDAKCDEMLHANIVLSYTNDDLW